MSRRWPYLLPGLGFLIVAAYLAVALRPDRDPSLVPSALIDRPAPEFSLPPLLVEGAGLSRADLQGGVVLVNFFASWCLPCRDEHPLLERLARDEGVTVYGIAWKDKPEAARAWLAELGNPFARTAIDESGRTGIDFGVYGVPETYLIDGDGRIRYRHVGALDVHTLESVLLPRIRELRA